MERRSDYDIFVSKLGGGGGVKYQKMLAQHLTHEDKIVVSTDRLPNELPNQVAYQITFVAIFDGYGRRPSELEGLISVYSPYKVRIPGNIGPDVRASGFHAICVAVATNNTDHRLFPVCQASLPGRSIMADKTRPLYPNRVYEGYLYSKPGDSFHFEKVAVKMDKRFRDVKLVAREFRLACRAASSYVVRYYAWNLTEGGTQQGEVVWIAMELCRRNTLRKLIQQGALTSSQKKIIAKQLLLGLSHLHGRSILHRDLTLDNILISKSGKYIKIGDLDHVKQTMPGTSHVSVSMTKGYNKLDEDLKALKENIQRRSGITPEPNEYRAEDDVLLAAVIILQCFTDSTDPGKGLNGKWYQKFFTHDKDAQLAFAMERFEIEEPLLGFELIKDMINDRPTAEDTLKHPFFWDAKKKFDFIVQMKNFFWPFVEYGSKNTPDGITKDIIDKVRRSRSGNWVKDLGTLQVDMEEQKQLSALQEKAMHTSQGHNDVFYLLKFIRNIPVHYHEDDETQDYFSSRGEVWTYFSRAFPFLLSDLFTVIRSNWPELAECEDFPNDAHHFFATSSAPLLNLPKE